MQYPDYSGGSIVNLMAVLERALGGVPLYPQLSPPLDVTTLSGRRIALIVIDGLGYNFLVRHGSNTVLGRNLRRPLTSVFPPTTASAITSFLTGVAPQQHGLTGWFMFLREIGMLARILPYTSRATGESIGKNIPFTDIVQVRPFPDRIRTQTHLVLPRNLLNTFYNTATAGQAVKKGYTNLNGFFRQIRQSLHATSETGFVYAYWPELDSICHDKGAQSRKAIQHFNEIEAALDSFLASMKNKNITVIVTADHGLVDTRRERCLMLSQHPELSDCLCIPFCGDARVKYCYVHPEKASCFERYVQNSLSHACTIHKSMDLLNKNLFGLYQANSKLKHRIGDYTLIMKENYVFRDKLTGEKSHRHIGNHGGMSDDELRVPLVVFE